MFRIMFLGLLVLVSIVQLSYSHNARKDAFG